MPRVPIESQLAPLRLPRMQAGYQHAPLEYAGRGLEDIGSTFRQIQAGAEQADITRQVAEGHAKFNDTLLLGKQKYTDPEQYNAEIQVQLDDAYRAIGETDSNPRVKAAVKDRLTLDYQKSKTQGKVTYFEKKENKARGDFVLAGEQLVNSLAKAGSAENRNQLTQMFNDLTDGLKEQNYLTPQQAETAKRKFVEEGEKARAEYMRQVNPEGLKKALAAGEFPSLDAYIWEQRANETIRETDLAAQKLQKERVEAVNKNLLQEMETTRSLNAFKSKILGMKDELPDEVYKFWIDRANRRIEDQQRDEERVKAKAERAEAKREREVDRAERRLDRAWNASNGAILGSTIQGILSEPDKWTQERILKQMGPGPDGKPRLGIHAAQQAVALLEQRTKDPVPKNFQPLQQAVKDLDFYRDQQLFIPKDKRGKLKDMDPEELLINNEKHQRVMRDLISRSMAGGDPQQILNESMQPFMEEAVKTWYERTFTEFFPGSAETRRDERVEARQRLARQGHPITEENIQKVIGLIRKGKTNK